MAFRFLAKDSLTVTNALKQATQARTAANAVATQANAFRKALHDIPETEYSELSNMLRIGSENTGGSTCTVGAYIKAGSRQENPGNNGVANFLEHLSLKGTHNRSEKNLVHEIGRMGASVNASTGREYTAFTIKCFSRDLPQAVNILADIVTNSTLDEEAIERERAVILHDMEVAGKDHESVALDHLHRVGYQGTGLALSVLGTTANVKENIQKAHLQEFKDSFYVGGKTVIAAAGGVDHDELVGLVSANFADISTFGSTGYNVVDGNRFTGAEIRDRNDEMPLAHVALAVEGPALGHPDFVPMQVASAIVGSWNRSLGASAYIASGMARSVHQKQLCHAYSSFNVGHSDTGLFGGYYVTEPLKVYNMAFKIQDEWVRLGSRVTDSELQRAKNLLKTHLLLGLDGSTAVCDDIGSKLSLKAPRASAAELCDKIDAVTARSIKEVTDKYIKDRCLAASGVGPVEGLPDYNELRSNTYWLF